MTRKIEKIRARRVPSCECVHVFDHRDPCCDACHDAVGLFSWSACHGFLNDLKKIANQLAGAKWRVVRFQTRHRGCVNVRDRGATSWCFKKLIKLTYRPLW